jgi:gamma-glutamylcyclotransferase
MESRVWYFAYGSNMQRATFVGRRGMRPDLSRWGRLHGYRLTFDLAIGSGERGVANIAAAPLATVCGVLHRITHAEFEILDRTEGVNHGVYERACVEVLAADGAAVEAVAYISSLGVAGRKPSPRYLGLLLDGAREHDLPGDYVNQLQSLELAVDERE